MEEAAGAQEFERAALFRDRLAAIRSLMERQQVAGEAGRHGRSDRRRGRGPGGERPGLPGPRRRPLRAAGLLPRQPRARTGSTRWPSSSSRSTTRRRRRCRRWSSSAPSSPSAPELLAEALGERRGTAVEVRAAERGDKRRLRELAERNAKLALAQDKLRRERRRRERTEALSELAEAVGMDEVPIRIEGYDISNLGPEHTVASMVVFEGGAPKKSDYRRFRIRGVERRLRRLRLDERGALPAARPLRRRERQVAARRRARRELRRAARPDHDRRRQGPARRRRARRCSR